MTDLPRRRPRDGEQPSAEEQDRVYRNTWFSPPSVIRRPTAEQVPASADVVSAGGAEPGRLAIKPAVAGSPVIEQRVMAELRWLRNEVPGIDGSMVATSDGLLVTHDLLDLEPTQAAALIATTLSIARRATGLTSRGQLCEAVVRGSTGYLAVFAIGTDAVLAVLGAQNLNVGMLHYQTREAVRRLEKDAAGFRRFADVAHLRALSVRPAAMSRETGVGWPRDPRNLVPRVRLAFRAARLNVPSTADYMVSSCLNTCRACTSSIPEFTSRLHTMTAAISGFILLRMNRCTRFSLKMSISWK
jgi:uncharacterized protein